MTDKIFVKPYQKDTIVANPDNKGNPLSHDGEHVESTKYWRRRLKDGDVVITKPAKTKNRKD